MRHLCLQVFSLGGRGPRLGPPRSSRHSQTGVGKSDVPGGGNGDVGWPGRRGRWQSDDRPRTPDGPGPCPCFCRCVEGGRSRLHPTRGPLSTPSPLTPLLTCPNPPSLNVRGPHPPAPTMCFGRDTHGTYAEIGLTIVCLDPGCLSPVRRGRDLDGQTPLSSTPVSLDPDFGLERTGPCTPTGCPPGPEPRTQGSSVPASEEPRTLSGWFGSPSCAVEIPEPEELR